jgi:TonB family protein
MNTIIHHIVLFLFPKEYNGVNNPISNQPIFSRLKNRLTIMTQQPSLWPSKWKYSGVLPILMLVLLVVSFRPKEKNTSYQHGRSTATLIGAVDGNSERPIFPGCEKLNLMEIEGCSKEKLDEYVADHLIYPEEMKKAKSEGKVYVGFEITKNGLVSNPKIKMTLNPAADQAALVVVNSMNETIGKWTPGTKDGIPVSTEMVLTVNFVLEAESKDEQSNYYDEPFTYVEHMPAFPGGQASMYEYLYKAIKYPSLAKDNQIQGIVIIQFVVTAYGAIHKAKVVRGIGWGCNEEALRAVNCHARLESGTA